jgi:hypothetical protein
MAIFASTTLGTSDPSRAMSIKALRLEPRFAAAQSKQEAPTVPGPGRVPARHELAADVAQRAGSGSGGREDLARP